MKTLILSLFAASLSLAAANDWPSWRGPAGDGTLPDDAAYPESWSADSGILWRVDLPDRGNSSPVVAGGRVFLTQSEDGGKRRSLVCYDARDGAELWKRVVEHTAAEATHQTNDHCAASPLVHGDTVYAWHGNAGLHAYGLDGAEKWSRDLGTDYEHIWGPNAASPVAWNGALLIHAGPGLAARLISVRQDNGEILWQHDLPGAASAAAGEFKGSWATPLLVDNQGRAEALLGLPGSLRSFAPATGEELWRVEGLGDLCYTNVAAADGLALYLCGYGGPGLGTRLPGPGETGDLTAKLRLWADPPKGQNQNPQRIGSGQIVDGHLYLLNEPGVMQCLRADTGETVWRERLGQKSWSSMNRVGGKLYVNEKNGDTHVIAPDPAGLKKIATNPVDPGQHTNASLAFAGGRIYLRTDRHLYAIGGAP